jgi:hypothetical protein
MKRFVVGFLVGVGLMYWYLQRVETGTLDTSGWFEGAASNYRDDRQHRAADDLLGQPGNR